MKTITRAIVLLVLGATLAGCIVLPPFHGGGRGGHHQRGGGR